jgi:RND family efflux transporter MFP subunit
MMSLLLLSCGGSSVSPQEQVKIMEASDTTVTAETLKPTTYEMKISQPGTTYAIRDVQLEARVTGYIEAVDFKDGAIVKKGDRLFQIDPRPFEASLLQARGNLEQAIAARNLAAHNVERNRSLVETGAVSREQFDTYVSSLEQNEGLVEAAAGELVGAELNLGYTTIRAPYTGRLGQREVELGSLVQASGSPQLVSIVQYDPMRCLVSLPSNNLEQLNELMAKGEVKASVRVNGTRGGGGKVFQGVVDFLDNQVDPNTSTVLLRVRFDNPDAWAFPGQYSEVDISVEHIENAIVIPEVALRAQQGGGQFVWLIGDKDKITRQDVTVENIRSGNALISKGLRSGQKIVVLGSTQLAAGDKVTIVTDPSKVEGAPEQTDDQKAKSAVKAADTTAAKAKSSTSSGGGSSSKSPGTSQ